MITDEVLEKMKKMGIKLTESHFAVHYLKSSRSYLSNRRAMHRDVSNDVLLNLYSELSSLGSTWQEMAISERNEQSRSAWQMRADRCAELASDVASKLLERARSQA